MFPLEFHEIFQTNLRLLHSIALFLQVLLVESIVKILRCIKVT